MTIQETPIPKSLTDRDRDNLLKVISAAIRNKLCILSAVLKETGETVPVICEIYKDSEGMINTIPYGMLFKGSKEAMELFYDPTIIENESRSGQLEN